MRRSSAASSRSLAVTKAVMIHELPLLSVSGMAVLGTTPYFVTRLTNMSHWPPSWIGLCNRNMISLPSVGSSSVPRMLSRK